MSLREEDKNKTGGPSRGLGLAAAAVGIGVGIGAALYYIFSKQENPDTEGATSAQWNVESPQSLDEDHNTSNDYTTVSEHTTTDTSVYDDTDSSSSDSDDALDTSSSTSNDSSSSSSDFNASLEFNASLYNNSSLDNNDDSSINSDWVADTSLEYPPLFEYPLASPLRTFLDRFVMPTSPRSRERSWSLEECSICFEVILKNQEVMSLPCTHHFHQSCILPWLQEQQTCPNCRKSIN